MDSQENTLKQEITEQTVTSADSTDNKITDTDVATSEQPVKEEVQHKVYNNKKEVVERLKEIRILQDALCRKRSCYESLYRSWR